MCRSATSCYLGLCSPSAWKVGSRLQSKLYNISSYTFFHNSTLYSVTYFLRETNPWRFVQRLTMIFTILVSLPYPVDLHYEECFHLGATWRNNLHLKYEGAVSLYIDCFVQGFCYWKLLKEAFNYTSVIACNATTLPFCPVSILKLWFIICSWALFFY